MKLFARYPEMSNLDICLFSTPINILKQAIDGFAGNKNINIITKVQTYRWRKEALLNKPNKFHQVVLEYDLNVLSPGGEYEVRQGPRFKLYSKPMNHDEVKSLGLEPIEKIKLKEKMIYIAGVLQER